MRPPSRVLAAAAIASMAAACALALATPAGAATRPQRAAALAALDAASSPSGVTAAAAELLDATTGQPMWTRSADVERPMASITKVMTAYIVIKANDLTRKIRVTQAAEDYGQAYGPSEAGLIPGDVLTTRQVLTGLLLPSGSDAAYLLATTYGPGWQAFVRKMNATARRLGMTHTHYANFDGLPWPTEYTTYSTASDLLKLAVAAMKLPAFRQIVDHQSYTIKANGQHHYYHWTNTNLLLGSYPGAIGIKTGFTMGAGYCLLFAARRDGTELLGVVLDSTLSDTYTRFTSAANMLNWGFATIAHQAGNGAAEGG
jgi:serine-type D-Ala-D-Ala carboxypeptidase (penicillin-binding protein 5/6)